MHPSLFISTLGSAIFLVNSLISPSVTAHILGETIDNHLPFFLIAIAAFSFLTSERFVQFIPHRLLVLLLV